MRKSNWIVFALLIVISAFLLYLWYALNFNRIDSPLDLVLSIVWWLIVAGAVALIWNRENARRRAVRTCYVAPTKLFNNELGLMDLAPGEDAAKRIETALDSLDYSFHVEDFPGEEDEKGDRSKAVNFVYVVRSEKFAGARKEGSDEEPEWQGEVAVVSRPNDEPKRFSGFSELQAILSGAASTATA